MAVDRDNSSVSDAHFGKNEVTANATDAAGGHSAGGELSRDWRAGLLSDSRWSWAGRHQQKLQDLLLFAVDAALRGKADQWWQRAFRFEALPRPEDGIAALRDFCLHHLLYEAGDVSAFCRVYETLDDEGYLDVQGRFLLELARYVKGAFPQPEERPPSTLLGAMSDAITRATKVATGHRDRRSAVVSIVVPDQATFENFFEFGGPSLGGKRNLETLAQLRDVRLLVYAKANHLPDIRAVLHAAGPDCQVICRPIPQSLLDLAARFEGPQRDWMVGALQSLHLIEAKRLGSDFFSVNPNGIYCEGFFEQILGISGGKKPVVLLATIRAHKSLVRAHLDPFRTVRAPSIKALDLLSVPTPDLLSAGLGDVDPSWEAKFVDGFSGLRGNTAHQQLMWLEDGYVRVHSTRYEIAFLAREIMRELPSRFFAVPAAEVDCLLPPSVQPYFIQASDQVGILELGGTNSTPTGDAIEYAELGALIGEGTRERQRRLFNQPICLPLPSEHRTSNTLPDFTGEANRRAVFRSVSEAEASPRPKPSQALAALSLLQLHEASDYGLEDINGTIREAQRILDVSHLEDATLDDVQNRELIRASLNVDQVSKAIALAKKARGSAAFIGDFLVNMTDVKAANATRARSLRKEFKDQSISVIGSVVWGEKYLEKFLGYCVPSLLAAGNIPALSIKGKVVHSIVTTENDRDRIVAHPVFRKLSEFAEVVFTCFPEEFLEARERSGYNFYYFYGFLDHQNVFLAAALQADLYLLPIDCVYSNECLRNFSARLEGGADCCTIAGVEADEAQLREWLEAKTAGGALVLDLDSKELLQTAIQRPDAYFRSLIMSSHNRAFCNHPRELVWPLSDGLVVHSIFMHPLATSARMLTRPFHPQHENVDFALLPRLLQGDGVLAIVQDAQEAAIAHFGAPRIRDDYLDGGFSLQSFMDAHKYDYAVHRSCFATGQVFACQSPPYPPATDYPGELTLIQRALTRYRFRVDPREASSGCLEKDAVASR